jgi:ubiquinol-cytochrome c reductase cytochrome b subunit
MPREVGWPHVLGGTLLFLIAVQIVTGIAMSLYYAPTPDHAYESVRYLTNEVRAGWWIRGLHKSAASLTIVVLLLHILRVFVHGAYRRPREVTWFAGIGLLVLMAGFAFTGYLLPWDQKAYWATVVGTRVMDTMPGLGPVLADLLRGGRELGALTLSRFYTLHAVVFPALLVLVAGAHLILIRKHGPATGAGGAAGSGGASPGDTTRSDAAGSGAYPFYPYQAFRDTLSMFLAFLLLFVLTHFFPPDLDAIADPSDTSYVPRPEWYFLSLFQLLRYFEGPFEIVGTAILPALVLGAMIALPFLDRGARGGTGAGGRRAAGAGTGAGPEGAAPAGRGPAGGESRAWAKAVAALVVLVLGVLTWLGAASGPGGRPTRLVMTPADLAGKAYAAEENCASCHGEGAAAPPLERLRRERSAEWIDDHLRNPTNAPPDTTGTVPGPDLKTREALQAYMARAHERRAAIRTASEELVLGGRTIYESTCLNCHRLFGEGGKRAPDLTEIGREHDAEWLRVQIANPKDHDPDSMMPAFGNRFTPEELRAVANYLASLR